MRFPRLPLGLLLLLAAPALADDAAIPTLPIGAKAPDFDLEGVDGKRHALKDFADAKVLAIVFTCNHCPTAQAYEDRLKALVDDYKGKGVAVVAISPNDEGSVRLDELGYTDLGDSFEEMKARARRKKFNYPYLYEGDKTGIARAYGPSATPEIFVFDADRKLRYVGRIDDSERESLVKVRDARHAIDALLAGKDVPVAKTSAFGCSTKWATKAGVGQAVQREDRRRARLRRACRQGRPDRPAQERGEEGAARERLGDLVRPLRRGAARRWSRSTTCIAAGRSSSSPSPPTSPTRRPTSSRSSRRPIARQGT